MMPEKIGTILQRLLMRYDIFEEIEKGRLISEWYKLSDLKISAFCHPDHVEGAVLFLKANFCASATVSIPSLGYWTG